LPNFDLHGRLALVTGSSRGLGWAMARGLAQAGARVVLHGRDRGALAQRMAELDALGAPAAGIAAFDVTDGPASVAGMAAVAAEYGPLGILVNNAGVIVRKPATETTDAEWQRVLDADLTACFRLSREAIKQMLPQGWGRIIMTSSIMGRVARPTVPGYVTAKHALVGLDGRWRSSSAARGSRSTRSGRATSRPRPTRPCTRMPSSTAGSPRARRLGAGAGRRSWRGRRFSWPPRRPVMLPDRSLW
jgi:NAD(P)-dependent dehydrogenase (short-subunit alcohol dehydrogenase family)